MSVRRSVALVLALPLLAMYPPLDSPSLPPTVPLVPVTRSDSALDGVRLSDLRRIVVPADLTDARIEGLPGILLAPDADPIARVRRTGEVAFVPAGMVTTAVKTLELDGHFFWRDADRRGWPVQLTGRSDAIDQTWSVIAAGEMIFGRGVQERIEDRFRGDASAAFANVRDLLAGADLAVATLEAPLSGTKNVWCDTCMRFVGNEGYAQAIAGAGIDVVSLAANHSGDAGPKGVLDTIRALDEAKVAHVGAGANIERARERLVTSVGGRRVAFLAYDGVAPYYAATSSAAGDNPLRADGGTYAALRTDIARASLDADVTIVLAHWGTEYEDAPRDDVVAVAHAMVDAGAAVVVGDHPHWVQSVERYRGAYIAYSVGNFVFDQMWSDETRQGSLHELWFSGDRLVAVRIRPTLIEDYYRPRPLRPEEPAYRTVLRRIWRRSVL